MTPHSPAELRLLQARVEELQRQLAEHRRFRSHVARHVSHDLRGSLTAITGLVEVLQEGGGLPRDLTHDYLGRIHRQCRLLAVTVADLQHLADPQQLPLVRVADLDLAALLDHVRELVPDLEMTVEGAAGVTVRGDAQRLEQALWNLLRNVVRHGLPPASVVAVRGRPSTGGRTDGQPAGEDVVELVVRDAGPGLDQHAAATAFEQRAAVEGTEPALGAGLWLVSSALRVQGGAAVLRGDPDGRVFPALVLPAGTGQPPDLVHAVR